MLFLIGLGLDTKDISVKALEIIKKSDMVLLDPYTNSISKEYVDFLETTYGKTIGKLSRSDLEENIAKTVNPARIKDVALLVSGDPLMATTHQIILEECRRQNVDYKVMHGSSIITAVIGESGLIPYKFGKATTIPFWTEKYKPVSFIDIITSNLSNDAHTIVLLDYDYIKGQGLKASTAADQLLRAEAEVETGMVSKDTMVLVMADIGKKSEDISYIKLAELLKASTAKSLEGKIVTLIIPAPLTVTEKENTSRLQLQKYKA